MTAGDGAGKEHSRTIWRATSESCRPQGGGGDPNTRPRLLMQVTHLGLSWQIGEASGKDARTLEAMSAPLEGAETSPAHMDQ